jgi:hypothetical protein
MLTAVRCPIPGIGQQFGGEPQFMAAALGVGGLEHGPTRAEPAADLRDVIGTRYFIFLIPLD